MRNQTVSKPKPPLDLGNLLTGIVIGGMVSTATMLLTAPQSGRKTRAQIRQKALELRDQAADTLDETWQQAEDAMRQARLKTRQLKRNARSTVKELQHHSQVILEEQKERVGSTLNALQPSNGHD